MTHSHKLTGKQLISRASFCFGNLGHSAFYGVMSTYFIIFVTSGMFAGLSKTVANKLIGLITGLIVSVRILELLIDRASWLVCLCCHHFGISCYLCLGCLCWDERKLQCDP